MNLFLAYINSAKLKRMLKVHDYLLSKDNKFYGKIADRVDRKIDNMYKFKTYKLDKNINYELMKNNPQFRIVNDKEYRIATRNEINKNYSNIKIYKGIEKLKKIKIVHAFFTNVIVRNTVILTSASIYNYSVEPSTSMYITNGLMLSTMFLGNIINNKYNYAYSEKLDNELFGDILNDLEDIYQEVINRFCLLAYQLKINDPISLMALYNILTHFGCLSVDHKFKYYEDHDANDYNSILHKFGYDIILGKGVCRHHSVFFRDICLRMGYDSKVLVLNNIHGDNHAIVEVKDEDNYLYLDPYNQTMFNYSEEKKKLIPIIGESQMELINLKYKDRKIMRSVGFYSFNKKNKCNFTDKEFIIKYSDSNSIIFSTGIERIMESFYRENKQLYVDFSKLCNNYFVKVKSK